MKALKSDPGTKISSVETKISSVEVKPSKKIDGCGKEEVDLLKAESQKQATRMERLETKIEKVDLKTGRLSVALWLYAAIVIVETIGCMPSRGVQVNSCEISLNVVL